MSDAIGVLHARGDGWHVHIEHSVLTSDKARVAYVDKFTCEVLGWVAFEQYLDPYFQAPGETLPMALNNFRSGFENPRALNAWTCNKPGCERTDFDAR